MSHALGGVRINVPVEHLAHAHAVLTQRNSGDREAALLDLMPFKRTACRACGSTALQEERSWSAVLLAMCLLFVGNAIFPPPREVRCMACGGDAVDEPAQLVSMGLGLQELNSNAHEIPPPA